MLENQSKPEIKEIYFPNRIIQHHKNENSPQNSLYILYDLNKNPFWWAYVEICYLGRKNENNYEELWEVKREKIALLDKDCPTISLKS